MELKKKGSVHVFLTQVY